MRNPYLERGVNTPVPFEGSTGWGGVPGHVMRGEEPLLPSWLMPTFQYKGSPATPQGSDAGVTPSNIPGYMPPGSSLAALFAPQATQQPNAQDLLAYYLMRGR